MDFFFLLTLNYLPVGLNVRVIIIWTIQMLTLIKSLLRLRMLLEALLAQPLLQRHLEKDFFGELSKEVINIKMEQRNARVSHWVSFHTWLWVIFIP